MIKNHLQPLQLSWSQVFHGEDDGSNIQGGGLTKTTHGQPQQQQQDDFIDPYKDIDFDLLDDTTRMTLEKTRDDMKKLHNDAKESRKWQSRYDSQQVQLEQLKLQTAQPKDTTKPPTFHDELIATYTELGYSPDQAAQLAKVNGKVLEKFADRTQKYVESTIGPVANVAAVNQAASIFEAVESSGIMASPEVSESVWQQVEQLAKNGEQITDALIQNLAIIANFHSGQQQQITSQPPIKPIPMTIQHQGGTRFSYPGAGRHVTVAAPRFQPKPLDPDTAAAVAATKTMMLQFGKQTNGKVKSTITRGGQ